MAKKKLKGFTKTKHFQKRQKDRGVSDLVVKKTLSKGKLIKGEDAESFVLGEMKVTVDYDKQILITVHPGDPVKNTSKVLKKTEAQEILTWIEEHQIDQKTKEVETNF